MRKLIILLALLTLTPSAYAQFQQADLYINVTTTCAATTTFTLAGLAGATNNTAFILNLNCNITSSSIAGFPQVGNRIQFSITNAGGFTLAWPSNFVNPPPVKTSGETDVTFWYDGTNWHVTQTVNTGASVTITGATPSVSGGTAFITNNGSATTITNFSNPTDGQSIVVNCGDTNTTIANNSNIVTFSGSNIACATNQAYQFTFYGSISKWVQNGGGTGASPAGNLGDTQCRNGASFVACSNNPSIRYVSSTGNDSNSGLTWDTAVATIDKALELLPGGSTTAPLTAGAGTVYFGDNVQFDTNVAHGLWLMGPSDPNYNNPPPGWLHSITQGTLALIGQGCQHWPSNGREPQCQINFQDFTTNNPILVPNTFGPFLLANAIVGFHAGKTLWLGTNSNFVRTNSSPVLQTYRNLAMGSDQQSATIPRGPGIDIGNNAFGITFDHVTMQANVAQQAIIAANPTGLVGNGTTLTITFTAPNTVLATGQKCGILGTNNPGFHFTGTITVVDSTHVTMPTTLNATGGGGVLICDEGIPAVIARGTGESAGGIYFRDATWNGGGVKAYELGNAGVFVEDVYTEGNFTNCASPALWVVAEGGGFGNQNYVKNTGSADQCSTAGPIPIIKVEGTEPAENVQVIAPVELPYTEGSMVYLGDSNYNANPSPLARNEIGVVRSHLEAQTDVHRRSPQSVRYHNFIVNDPTTWVTPNLTVTTGQIDNDGGTSATKLVATSQTTLSWANGFNIGGVWNVGDMGICGVWMKNLNTPDPYNGNSLLSISCSPSQSNAASGSCNLPVVGGDGQWDWYFCYFTVTVQTTPINFTTGTIFNGNSFAAYMPFLAHIPAGQLSNNELVQLAYDMRSTSSGCVAGQMCDSIGPLPHLNIANNGWSAVQTFPGAATSQYFDVQQVAFAPANPPVAGCRLFTLSGVLNGVSSTGTNCLPSGGGGGGGNVSSSGTPANGQLAQWVNSTNIQGVSLVPASNFPALTQDVNNTAGSLVTTVNGLKGNPVPTLSPGWLQWNGSVLAWTNPPTNVGAASTVGDLASYNSLTTVADSGVVAANVVTNTTNLVNANLVQGTGNHTVADSTIAIANVTQNSTAGTTNALPKWAGPHTLTNSSVSDNGTFITSTESVDLQTNALVSEYANAGSTGTTINKLAKFTGAPSSVVLAATTDTNGIIGICVGNCGTTGTAQIAISGQVSCVFSNATTAGHYVQISSATAGDCVDSNSATPPATGQIIGRVLSTNGSAGTYVIDLYAADLSAGGSGGGSGTINASTQFSIPFYSGSGSNTIISGVAAPTSPNNVPYFWVSTANAGNATAPQLLLGGVPVNSSLGSTPYTMATTDRLSELQGNPSSAFVINLPNGGTSGFSNNFASVIRNYGTAPFNLVAPGGINLNGVSAGTLTHLPNWTAWMWQDASNNLWVSRMPTHEAFGPTCANGVTWSTTTGLGCLGSLPVLGGSIAGGDLGSTYPNPTVTGVGGLPIPGNALVIGTNGSNQLISATLAGTDTKVMTASTVTGGAGATVCLDANNGITTTGCTGPVLTLTGDGALITNSLSSGAVTLTTNALVTAHKWWGNSGSSTGAAGFNFIGTADLPTGIPNANLANASTTPNGQTCTLGSTCNVNSGAATHSVALNEGAGAAIAGVACGAGTTIQGAASADPTCTQSPTLGVQNGASGASTLTLSGASAGNGTGTLVLNNTGTTPKALTVAPGSVASVTVTGPNVSGTMLVSSTTDFPEVLIIPAANCNNATGGAGWSIGSGGTVTCRAGTNNLGGYIPITDTASTFATFQVAIPEDWDTAVNPYIRFQLASTDATNAHTVIPEFRVACYKGDGSTTDDVAPNAFHSSSTVTLNGNANRFWSTSNIQMNATDMTGCVAGALMQVTVGRATDTATNAEFYSATITIPRLLTVQAN